MAVIAIAVVACVHILITAAQRSANASNLCQVSALIPILETASTIEMKWHTWGGYCKNVDYSIGYNEKYSSQRRYRRGRTAEKYVMLQDLKACTEYQITIVHYRNKKQISTDTKRRDTGYEQPPPPQNVTVTVDNVTHMWIQWERPEDRVINCNYNYLLELYLISAADCATLEEFKCLIKMYNQTTVQNNMTLSTAGLNECAWYAVSVISNYNGHTNQVQRRVSARFSIANAIGTRLKVKNLLLVDTQTSWLTVKWKPIEQYANCVVSYRVTVKCAVKPCVGAVSEIVNGTIYNATGLEQCSKYRIKVVSLDYLGEDIGSPASIIAVTDSRDAIRVQNLMANSLSPNVIYLNWTLPPDKEQCVNSYSVVWNEISNGGVTVTRNVTVTDNWLTITNLDICHHYAFNLYLHKEQKFLGLGGRFNAFTSPERTNLTVKNLFLVDKQASWLTVRWNPIEQYANCVVSYQVTVFCTMKPCVGAALEVVNSTTYNATGLEQCSMYRIDVVSLDSLGNDIGQPVSVTAVTSSQDTISVQSLTANSLTPNTVYLRWTLPPDKQLCVNSYSIFWNEVNSGGVTASNNVAVNDNSYTIKMLEACHPYTFNLYLHERQKVLGLGGSVNVSTLSDTPGKVQNLRAVGGSHSIKLFWDQPAISGSCVNRYLVSYMHVNNTGDLLRQSLFTRKSNIVVVPSKNTTVELNDMPACVTYNISVYAVSVDNSESKPETIIVTVASEVLPNPSSGTVLHIIQTSATLQWNIPYTTKNMCPMIKMEVQCASSENGRNTITNFKNRDSLGNVKGIINSLTPYTKYKCKAKAYSSAGVSVSKESTDMLTIQGIPSQPTNVTIAMRTSSKILVMWSPPTQKSGVLGTYTVHVRKQYLTYFVPTSCTQKVFKDYNISVPANRTSVWLSGLQPATSMIIAVNAATGVGNGPNSADVIATTLSGESEPIRNLNVRVSQNKTKITWKHPCYTNGDLFNFVVELSATRAGYPNLTRMSWSNKATIEKDPVYAEIFTDLKPEYIYSIQVSPIGLVAGSCTSITFQALASIPPEPSLPVMSSLEPVPTYAQADLTLYSNLFSDSNGHILYYAILLSEGMFPVDPQSGWIDGNVSWPAVDTWSIAYKNDPVSMYQATPVRWNPFSASSPYQTVEVTYTLGKDECSSIDPNIYCNGPLNPGTTYALRIRAFTSAGYRDSYTIKFKTEAFTSFITLTIISLVVTIIATISIFMYLLSTGRITRMTQEVAEKNQNVEVGLEFHVLTPIPVRKFLTHCNMILNSAEKLKEEFQLLTTMSADIKLTSDIALLPHNRKKNRYINVLPYDTNRVILEGEPDEGYINASYIRFPGEKPNIEYIACQAPKEEYSREFWQMMVQCNVSIIIMLCLKIEKGKVKCFIYYPQLSETMQFDDITVICTEKRMYQYHTVRTLVVTKGNQQYNVLHYHFVDWPDFGVPSTSDVMLHFCQAVRAASKYKDCVMAVHCSAGVGRTGTFITLDNLIRHIRNNKKMNVLATVLKLREQRANMVQTEMQYGYIYKCLKHALEHQADFLKGDAKAAERLARQDLYPITRRDSNFVGIDSAV